MLSDYKSPEASLLILYTAEVMCPINSYCGFFDKVKSQTPSAQVDAILITSMVCMVSQGESTEYLAEEDINTADASSVVLSNTFACCLYDVHTRNLTFTRQISL